MKMFIYKVLKANMIYQYSKEQFIYSFFLNFGIDVPNFKRV